MHGCGVASSTNILGTGGKNAPKVCQPGSYIFNTDGAGYQFLHALAYAALTPVTAALNCQLTDAHFRFEGPTVTVYQSGYEERSWAPRGKAAVA